MTLATTVVTLVTLYLAAGLVFAVAFVLRGASRIDPAAARGTWGFRLVILPGVMAFWPLLAIRWAKGQGPPEEHNAHRDAAQQRSERSSIR